MLDLLERRKRVLGPEHHLTVSSMQGVAVLYQEMPGRLEEAEPYLHDALAIYKATIGADHPRLAPEQGCHHHEEPPCSGARRGWSIRRSDPDCRGGSRQRTSRPTG